MLEFLVRYCAIRVRAGLMPHLQTPRIVHGTAGKYLTPTKVLMADGQS